MLGVIAPSTWHCISYSAVRPVTAVACWASIQGNTHAHAGPCVSSVGPTWAASVGPTLGLPVWGPHLGCQCGAHLGCLPVCVGPRCLPVCLRRAACLSVWGGLRACLFGAGCLPVCLGRCLSLWGRALLLCACLGGLPQLLHAHLAALPLCGLARAFHFLNRGLSAAPRPSRSPPGRVITPSRANALREEDFSVIVQVQEAANITNISLLGAEPSACALGAAILQLRRPWTSVGPAFDR